MKLDQLPTELIANLPFYLDSLEDLYSLIRTSKVFRDACGCTKAKLRPRFAKRYGQSLFPPHPHLLIAGTARSVADWAVRSNERRGKLIEALKGGIEGLYNLAVDVGRISLQEARDILKARYDVLNPLTRIIDLEAGPARRERRYAEDGETIEDQGSEWWTILEYPELTLLHHWIYCELFHHTFAQLYDPASMIYEPLSRDTRWTYLSYCVTDCNNKWVKVSENIFDQARSYAHSPFKGPIQCFMMIQQLLYSEAEMEGGDFNIERIAENLDGKDKATTLAARERFFYNLILHQGLLSMQLLLNKHEVVKKDIEAIRLKVLEIPDQDIVKEEPDQDKDANAYDPRWISIHVDCYHLIWGISFLSFLDTWYLTRCMEPGEMSTRNACCWSCPETALLLFAKATTQAQSYLMKVFKFAVRLRLTKPAELELNILPEQLIARW